MIPGTHPDRGLKERETVLSSKIHITSACGVARQVNLSLHVFFFKSMDGANATHISTLCFVFFVTSISINQVGKSSRILSAQE